MGNPKLIPYETIVRATSGEPEAVDEVLRHYSKRILLPPIFFDLQLPSLPVTELTDIMS